MLQADAGLVAGRRALAELITLPVAAHMARRPRSIGRYLERLALAAAFLLVTGTMLHAVRGYEQTLSGGRMVLVELAPVDPRSLMQGDYMALAFVIDRALAERWSDARELGEAPPRFAYLALDAEGGRLGDAADTHSGRYAEHRPERVFLPGRHGGAGAVGRVPRVCRRQGLAQALAG